MPSNSPFSVGTRQSKESRGATGDEIAIARGRCLQSAQSLESLIWVTGMAGVASFEEYRLLSFKNLGGGCNRLNDVFDSHNKLSQLYNLYNSQMNRVPGKQKKAFSKEKRPSTVGSRWFKGLRWLHAE